MAQFKDTKGREWTVRLDGPLIDEIESLHQINLEDLNKDPLLKLRTSPRTLVAVVYLICKEQIQALNLTPVDFARSLPQPPDVMLEAVKEAVIDFFPTGQGSHAREALASYEAMAEKTNQIGRKKMMQILESEKTTQILDTKADELIEQAMKEALDHVFPMTTGRGTSSTTAST